MYQFQHNKNYLLFFELYKNLKITEIPMKRIVGINESNLFIHP